MSSSFAINFLTFLFSNLVHGKMYKVMYKVNGEEC